MLLNVSGFSIILNKKRYFCFVKIRNEFKIDYNKEEIFSESGKNGDMAEELPIARSTLSEHLSELKRAGLIQGEINLPYIKYCINRENWEEAKKLYTEFFKR